MDNAAKKTTGQSLAEHYREARYWEAHEREQEASQSRGLLARVMDWLPGRWAESAESEEARRAWRSLHVQSARVGQRPYTHRPGPGSRQEQVTGQDAPQQSGSAPSDRSHSQKDNGREPNETARFSVTPQRVAPPVMSLQQCSGAEQRKPRSSQIGHYSERELRRLERREAWRLERELERSRSRDPDRYDEGLGYEGYGL